MKYVALAQLAFYAVIAALLGVGVFLLVRWLRSGDGAVAQISNALKDSPLGAPARGVDAAISAATGRDETLGGWLAELFDPATRQVNASLKRTKPITTPAAVSQGILDSLQTPPPSPYSINPRERN